MTKEEIRNILDKTLPRRQVPLDIPTEPDWKLLQEKFHCDFDNDFVVFIECLASYEFPGEIYDVVRSGRTDGNGTIASIYDLEMGYQNEPPWNADMIPFYGIGNGDCFCLGASYGNKSPVFYVYHEDGHAEEEYPTFEAFLTGLPELLSE